MGRLDPETGFKQCTKCKRFKEASEFHKNRAAPDGLLNWCKPCSKSNALRNYYSNKEVWNVRARDWKKKHPEAVKASLRRYYVKNPERYKAYRRVHIKNHMMHVRMRQNRKRGAVNDGTVTAKSLRALLDTWTGICPRCHKESDPTIDHIVPIAKGGAESLSNLQLMCRSCNSSKGAKDE